MIKRFIGDCSVLGAFGRASWFYTRFALFYAIWQLLNIQVCFCELGNICSVSGYNVIYVYGGYGGYDTSSIAYRGFIISNAIHHNVIYVITFVSDSMGGRFFAQHTPPRFASAIHLVFFALIPPTFFIAHYRGNKPRYKTTKPQVNRGIGAY